MAAGGNRIIPLGTARVNLVLGNLKGYVVAIVVDKLSRPLILGTDFLSKNRANIDFDKGIVNLKNYGLHTILKFKPTYKQADVTCSSIYSEDEEISSYNEEENKSLCSENEENLMQETEPYTKPETQPNLEPEKIKITVKEDYILMPGIEITIKLKGSTEIPDYKKLECFYFQENDIFLRPRGLICLSPIYFSGNNLVLRMLTRSHNKVKIFKGSTIGFLTNIQTYNLLETELFYVEDSKNDDSEVTIDDHKIGHIKDLYIKGQLKDLLQEFNDIFSKTPKTMGRTDLVEHEIEIGDALPIKQKPYRVSQKERDIIDKQITEMAKYDVIRPSHSPWASPVVLVKKKSGETRFCVDYRRLNNVTKKSSYSVPNIDDILTYLGKARYFSTLDMFSGFWQVKIKEECKPLTAFQAPGHGLWEFNFMSFGLCNAPATFQQLADQVFQDLKWKEVPIYLDDIIIFSETLEGHLEKLRKVFTRMREAGLTLKPSKCEYLKEKINILGFTVTKDGLLPEEAKLVAIKEFPKPKSVKNVQSFIGLCNYYRKCIKNFSVIARPLHEITKNDTGFKWEENQIEAFNHLKEKLITAPVLNHYNPDKDCELRVDASRDGIGAILLQEGEDEQPHPIAYASRSLTKAEKNYTITELEGLAAIWALGYLRHLIYGKPVKIVTDHHALCWLKSLKDPTGRLARWSIKLSEFDYTIVHKSGVAHKDADCLSRNPVLPPGNSENLEDIPTFLLESEDMAKLQKEDETLAELIQAVTDPQDSPIGVRRRAKNFRIIDGVLYKINPSSFGREHLSVIPKNLIGEVIYTCHSEPTSGHLGTAKTLNKIRQRFYWEKLQNHVERFIKGCPDCQARKGQQNRKPVGLLHPIPVGTPFQRVGIDLLGPFRRSSNGKTMIVVATDYATRWAETEALPSGKAGPVGKFILEKIITRHGAPKYLLSDRGKVFQSDVVKELLKKMGTTSHFTTSYHPSTNGLTERLNKTLADMISNYTNTNQTNWDQYLPHVTFAYNSSKQDTTHFSPFMLVYGREPILPIEATLMPPPNPTDSSQIRDTSLAIRNLAVENIKRRQNIDKIRYDSKHRHVEYSEGDQVKVFTPVRKVGRSEKLLLRWFGPYYITRKVSDVDYEIKKGQSNKAKKDIVHVSRILPYYDPWTPDITPQ